MKKIPVIVDYLITFIIAVTLSSLMTSNVTIAPLLSILFTLLGVSISFHIRNK